MFETLYNIREVEPQLSHGTARAFGRSYECLSKVVRNEEGNLLLQLSDKQANSLNTFHLPCEEEFISNFRIGLLEFLETPLNSKKSIPISTPLRILMIPLLLPFGARMKCGIPSLSLKISDRSSIIGILTVIGKERFLMIRIRTIGREASGVFHESAITDLLSTRINKLTEQSGASISAYASRPDSAF